MKVFISVILAIASLLTCIIITMFWTSNSAKFSMSIRVDYWYVPNSSLDEPRIKEIITVDKGNFTREEHLEGNKRCIQLLHKNHSLIASDQISLIIDKFDEGSIHVIDDEFFSRLTISIRKDLLRGPIYLPTQGVSVYYSDGAAAWVPSCLGWYGENAIGTINISSIAEGNVIADLNIIGFKSRPNNSDEKGQFHFDGRFKFHKTNLEEVDYWISKWDFIDELYKWHNNANSADR
jgi:hypothetical protein